MPKDHYIRHSATRQQMLFSRPRERMQISKIGNFLRHEDVDQNLSLGGAVVQPLTKATAQRAARAEAKRLDNERWLAARANITPEEQQAEWDQASATER